MLMEPVEIASIGAMAPRCPRRMIEPLPNCFSIWPTAMSMALVRSFRSSSGMRSPWRVAVPEHQCGSGGVTGRSRPGSILESVPSESQAKICRYSNESQPVQTSAGTCRDFRLHRRRFRAVSARLAEGAAVPPRTACDATCVRPPAPRRCRRRDRAWRSRVSAAAGSARRAASSECGRRSRRSDGRARPRRR